MSPRTIAVASYSASATSTAALNADLPTVLPLDEKWLLTPGSFLPPFITPGENAEPQRDLE